MPFLRQTEKIDPQVSLLARLADQRLQNLHTEKSLVSRTLVPVSNCASNSGKWVSPSMVRGTLVT